MSQPEYVHTKTLTFPNMTARIFSPVLTEEERNRRIKNIHKASANLILSIGRKKQ